VIIYLIYLKSGLDVIGAHGRGEVVASAELGLPNSRNIGFDDEEVATARYAAVRRKVLIRKSEGSNRWQSWALVGGASHQLSGAGMDAQSSNPAVRSSGGAMRPA
jgi:hypothetical protein